MNNAIEIFEQDGNKSVGIYLEQDGSFLAMTFSKSKKFKTEKGARKWIVKYL